MCRHLCYLGEPIVLAELLFDRPHALAVQSYAPREMRGGGSVNADGFGAGWFDGRTMLRYRRPGPIWQDSGFMELMAATRAGSVLAAVRNATTGMPVTETAAAPFTDGHWLFSLNGRIDGWPDSAVPLASSLDTRSLLTLDAPTDAALLWAMLRHRLAAGAPDPAKVLAELVMDVLAAAPGSRLNLLLADSSMAYATTVTHSLYVREAPVLIASEPLDDDPGWQPVPDGQLVVASRDGIRIEPIPGWRPAPLTERAAENRHYPNERIPRVESAAHDHQRR